jgi:hypothetical protein
VARAEGVESGRGAYTSVRGWLEARGAGAAVTRSEGRGRTTRRGAVTEADKSGRGMGRSARTSFDELDPEHNTSFGSSDESEGYDIAKITAPVAEDMEQMRMNLRDIIGRRTRFSEPVGSGCDRCWCFSSRGRRKS